MHYTTPIVLLSALFAAHSTAQLDVYTYPCSGCNCNGAFVSEFVDNGSNIGQCIAISVGYGPTAVGLSGGSSAHCTMYASNDCTGTQQSVGINNGQTFGCTDSTIGTFASLQCYTR